MIFKKLPFVKPYTSAHSIKHNNAACMIRLSQVIEGSISLDFKEVRTNIAMTESYKCVGYVRRYSLKNEIYTEHPTPTHLPIFK